MTEWPHVHGLAALAGARQVIGIGDSTGLWASWLYFVLAL